MKKFNLSAIGALLILSLVLAACGPLPGRYNDGHGNHGDSFTL